MIRQVVALMDAQIGSAGETVQLVMLAPLAAKVEGVTLNELPIVTVFPVEAA